MSVMTEQLRHAFERAQQLPDVSPHVQQKMLKLADEAWKEHEAGETEEVIM